MKSLLLGATVGAIAALLYAPKKGKETRKMLKDKFATARHEVARQVAKAKKMTAKQYASAVDQAVKMAEKTASTKTELMALRKELMGKWKMVQRRLKA